MKAWSFWYASTGYSLFSIMDDLGRLDYFFFIFIITARSLFFDIFTFSIGLTLVVVGHAVTATHLWTIVVTLAKEIRASAWIRWATRTISILLTPLVTATSLIRIPNFTSRTCAIVINVYPSSKSLTLVSVSRAVAPTNRVIIVVTIACVIRADALWQAIAVVGSPAKLIISTLIVVGNVTGRTITRRIFTCICACIPDTLSFTVVENSLTTVWSIARTYCLRVAIFKKLFALDMREAPERLCLSERCWRA